MEAVAVRVRLPAAAQRDAIFDAGLHEQMISDCQADIRHALTGAAQVLADRDEVDLDEIVQMLAANLAARPTVAGRVREAVALGGTALDEADFYRAIGVWIVDLQLDEALVWRPSVPVTRPGSGQ